MKASPLDVRQDFLVNKALCSSLTAGYDQVHRISLFVSFSVSERHFLPKAAARDMGQYS